MLTSGSKHYGLWLMLCKCAVKLIMQKDTVRGCKLCQGCSLVLSANSSQPANTPASAHAACKMQPNTLVFCTPALYQCVFAKHHLLVT